MKISNSTPHFTDMQMKVKELMMLPTGEFSCFLPLYP